MADQRDLSRTAPFYPIPQRQIVSVEHPAIIRNVDKAIDTLRGNTGISKILNPSHSGSRANLFLRPEDAMARPLQSTSMSSNNILLKVTVPKRTGRKRKRGSDEPFTDGIPVLDDGKVKRCSAKDLQRSLRDNVGRYTVEPVGRVERSHVFRGMPDFVFSTTASSFTNRFRNQVLSFDYEKVKQFDIDMSRGATSNVDIIPPPSFSDGDVPFSYIYRQNPAVKQSADESGSITTINTQQAAKVLTYLVAYDVPEVPSAPRESCPPIETLEKPLQETIAVLQSLFANRPAWTRRGLRNLLTTIEQRYALRHAIPYVGYIFRSGPWRDAIVKFGHDPRSSPNYRAYQTVMFRILPREAEVARDGHAGGGGGRRHTLPRPPESGGALDADETSTHIFTGQPPLSYDGKIWMVCDIEDPILRRILFPSNPPPPGFLRSECDITSDGWFGNGALAKMKTVMRHKIQILLDGRVPDDNEFRLLLTLPDHATMDSDLSEFTFDGAEGASSRDMQLATEVRATIKGAWAWRNREKTRQQYVEEKTGVAEEEEEKATARTGESAKKSVQWEESEGEEEELEREEIAAAVRGRDDDDEDDEEERGRREVEDDDSDDDDDEDI